jgi:prolipoprotein diacylglyceryltransferase
MLENFFQKSLMGKIGEVVVLLGAIVLGRYFEWEIANLLFFLFFLALFFHPVPSRLLAFGASLLLIVAAILYIFKKGSWAETSAIWAYYLMISTAFRAFSELHEEKDSGIINKN